MTRHRRQPDFTTRVPWDCPAPIRATLRWASWSPACHDGCTAILVQIMWDEDATEPVTVIWCPVCHEDKGLTARRAPSARAHRRRGVIPTFTSVQVGALCVAAAVMRLPAAAALAPGEIRELDLTTYVVGAGHA